MKWEKSRLLNFRRRSIIRRRRMEYPMNILRLFSTPLNLKQRRSRTNIRVLCKRPLHLPRLLKQRRRRKQTKSKWNWSNKPKKNIEHFWKNLRKRKKSMKIRYERKHKPSKLCMTPLYRKLLKMVKPKHQFLLLRRSNKRKRGEQPKNTRRSTRRRGNRIMLMICTRKPWLKEVKIQNCTQ